MMIESHFKIEIKLEEILAWIHILCGFFALLFKPILLSFQKDRLLKIAYGSMIYREWGNSICVEMRFRMSNTNKESL